MYRLVLFFSYSILLSACGVFEAFTPKTIGEINSGYTYVPIDSIPISDQPGRSCGQYEYRNIGLSAQFTDNVSEGELDFSNGVKLEYPTDPEQKIFYKDLLDSFPDNAVRVSIERFDSSGTVNIAGSSIGAEGGQYRVIIDYIISDTISEPLLIKKVRDGRPIPLAYDDSDDDENSETQIPATYSIKKATDFFEDILGDENPFFARSLTDNAVNEAIAQGFEFYNIPLYVGIGLRITANINSIDANVNIQGLGIIGAEAEAGRLSGSLVVQTLGVNGQAISSALPIQSELNRTTAQNAIVAIGSIKAMLYDDATVIEPRVVGLYLPFRSDKALVNEIISALSKEQISWFRPCERKFVDENGLPIDSPPDKSSS